ncbi:MAG TPA: ABC transporter substrate-binding protein [Gaiellales bacterium]
MNARRLIAMTMLAAVVATAAGCGGGGAAPGGGGGGGSTKGGILRVGTTSYIDSLNPFVAIESQSYNAFVMEYPQLVQYGPGEKLEGDWATSWDEASDGLTWTFHLKPGGKWSDGKPLTAADAAWTGNLIVKYQAGPTAALAAALTHVTSMDAPNATTLVIHYDKPVANVLPQLEQFFILPQHVWSKYVGTNGKGLKSFRPEQSLPTVAGGPYSISQYQEKGTTVFKPNPSFYGPKSNAQAVAMTYYTNSTSMIADLQAGNIDFADQVPYNAISSLQGDSSFVLDSVPSSEVTNITFNSNPLKPKNRELLNPQVREALEDATDRDQIVKVIYAGHARPWANMLSLQSGAFWLNPAIKPLPFDLAKANSILDSLGYKKGANGIRVVPATTGKYAQPAHPMVYNMMVPDSLDFNGDRQFQIIADDWKQAGVKLNEQAGGDSSQAYGIETAGKYTKFDLATWDWAEYVDPDAQLSYMTRAQWYSWSDTGYNSPLFNNQYLQQATLINPKQRQALVWKMEAEIAQDRPYIELVDEDTVTANDKGWTNFYPDLNGYCKCYYTSPHRT